MRSATLEFAVLLAAVGVQAFAAQKPASLAIETKSLPNAVVKVDFVCALTATGGVKPYRWSPVPGYTMPPDLKLSEAGIISGTPAAPGTYPLLLQVQDKENTVQSGQLTLSVVPPLALAIAPIPDAVVTRAFSHTLTASGGTPPYSWLTGPLPAGLAFSSSAATGTIAGTPAVAETVKVPVEVRDSSTPTPLSARMEVTLVVRAPLAISTSALSGTLANRPYAGVTMAAYGGVPPYTWSIPSGASPPPGLSLSTDGVLSGTPDTAGTHSFIVQVADRSAPAQVEKKTLSLIVAAPLSITTASLPNAVAPSAYSQSLAAANGTVPLTWNWSVAGSAPASLPPGLALNSATGAVTGTPTTPGTYSVTVQVTDSGVPAPQSATRALSLTVLPSFGGHVVGPDGAPIAGATVEALDSTGASVSAITGSDGIFSLPLTAGKYDFTAWAPGYQAQMFALSPDATAQVREFRLNTGRTGGQFYRVILGFQQAGASSSASVQKLFGDLYVDIPGPSLHHGRPVDPVYGNRLRFWGSVRFTSIPQAGTVKLSEADLTKTVSDLKTSELAQSFAFAWGPEFRIFGHPRSPAKSVYTGQSNNADDLRGGQKFTGSIILGFGAETPLDPQSTATVVDATVGDAQKLYHDITGATLDPKYTALALISEDRSRFLRQYFAGFRLKSHYFSPAGIPATRSPAILDVTLGQNEVVTDGRFHGLVFRVEGFFPLPYKPLNSFYLFGRASMRISGNPQLQNAYSLKAAPAGTTFPSPTVASLTLPPPSRDIYAVGIGVDLLTVVAKLIKPSP